MESQTGDTCACDQFSYMGAHNSLPSKTAAAALYRDIDNLELHVRASLLPS